MFLFRKVVASSTHEVVGGESPVEVRGKYLKMTSQSPNDSDVSHESLEWLDTFRAEICEIRSRVHYPRKGNAYIQDTEDRDELMGRAPDHVKTCYAAALRAVKIEARFIGSIDPGLRKHPVIILAAARGGFTCALQYLSEDYRQDVEFMGELKKIEGAAAYISTQSGVETVVY